MDQQKIGAFLKELRRERGLTQEDLAEEVGVARRTVSRWETGRSLPDLDLLPRLAASIRWTCGNCWTDSGRPRFPLGTWWLRWRSAAQRRSGRPCAWLGPISSRGRRCGQRAAGTDAERLRPVITAENGAGRRFGDLGKTA